MAAETATYVVDRIGGKGGVVMFVFDPYPPVQKRGIIAQDVIKDSVAAVSIGIVDGKILLDLCYEEDSKADVDMNFVMTGSGKFVEIQGTAESAPFSKKQMDKMSEIAEQGIKELLRAQRQALTFPS